MNVRPFKLPPSPHPHSVRPHTFEYLIIVHWFDFDHNCFIDGFGNTTIFRPVRFPRSYSGKKHERPLRPRTGAWVATVDSHNLFPSPHSATLPTIVVWTERYVWLQKDNNGMKNIVHFLMRFLRAPVHFAYEEVWVVVPSAFNLFIDDSLAMFHHYQMDHRIPPQYRCYNYIILNLFSKHCCITINSKILL